MRGGDRTAEQGRERWGHLRRQRCGVGLALQYFGEHRLSWTCHVRRWTPRGGAKRRFVMGVARLGHDVPG